MKRILSFLLLTIALRVSASTAPDEPFPVRGLCIAAPPAAQVARFVKFIHDDLAPRKVNTLILRVDFNYAYTSHPELRDTGALSQDDVRQLVAACREHGIHLIPQINLLGHQSWAGTLGALLRVYPEFDETPWVNMPEKYAWPNPDGLYCKSYCPLHPKVHEVVFALVDELCDAFETDAFHAGLDEVFYIGMDKCPRCSGKDKAELFAGEVGRIRDHLARKNRKLWMWGDRLLDGKTTGIGEWEASISGTHRAASLVPRDVVICDWHYELPHPTAAWFALEGFDVVTCPWKNQTSAVQQVDDMRRLRSQSTKEVKSHARGIVQTVWSGAPSFLDQYAALQRGDVAKDKPSEAACFLRVFEELQAPAHR